MKSQRDDNASDQIPEIKAGLGSHHPSEHSGFLPRSSSRLLRLSPSPILRPPSLVGDSNYSYSIREALVINDIRKATEAMKAIPRAFIFNADEVVTFDSVQRCQYFVKKLLSQALPLLFVPLSCFPEFRFRLGLQG